LVPYTEYLLYQQNDKTLALLNIGGIANVTLLPAGGGAADILAFDTGPGNMLIDAAAQALIGQPLDEGGNRAVSGRVRPTLLEKMRSLDREYLEQRPPKSTGRERYNQAYIRNLLDWIKGEDTNDALATITRYSAETIAGGIKDFCSPFPRELYVSGGGAHNRALMAGLGELLQTCAIRRGDELGIPADAKEAVAFAILANEAIHGLCNNAPSATGARHPVVMGKISFGNI
jgi:anhydro-N-acetylmuramic acid kinase